MYVAVTYLSVTCVHTKLAVLLTFNKVLVPTSEDDSQYFHFCFWNRVLLYYCRLALNCWPFCLGLLGSGIIGMHHLAKLSYTESYQNILLLASPGNWWPVVMKTGDSFLRFMTFVRISLLFLKECTLAEQTEGRVSHWVTPSLRVDGISSVLGPTIFLSK